MKSCPVDYPKKDRARGMRFRDLLLTEVRTTNLTYFGLETGRDLTTNELEGAEAPPKMALSSHC